MGAPAPPIGERSDGADDGPVTEARLLQHAPVLVIDDNERHLDIISALLSAAGFNVEACASGLDALFRLATIDYSALVLDMVMPGVNGQAVLDRLGGLPRNAGIPVVVCTANVSIAQFQLEGRAEVHAIVGKPINSRELISAVTAAMEFATGCTNQHALDHGQVRS